MKILFITNAYPNEKKPYYGIYVKEQYEFIKNNSDLECEIFILNGNNSFDKYFQPIRILSKLKSMKPDIIHVQFGLTGIPLLLIYPFISKFNIISTFHGSDINGSFSVRFISMLLAKISSMNIAVSEEIKLKLSKYKSKTITIPCGVDPIFFKTNKKERINKIIFSGHPSRLVKNYKLFEEIVYILKNQYNQQFEVIIFDIKTREEVKEALLTSKCLVLTSFSEGSPQVVKEAIVSNLPVVSTPVGDVPNLIRGLENNYICSTAEEFASNINNILNSNLEFNNAQTIKDKFNNNIVCNKIINLYKEII